MHVSSPLLIFLVEVTKYLGGIVRWVINRIPSSEIDLQLSVCGENINRTGELLKNTLVASSKSQFNDN